MMVAALILLPGMDAIAKHLSRHLPVLELIWGRYVFYTLVLIPLALWRHSLADLRSAQPTRQLLRGALMAASSGFFFAAIARMPLADAMAVFFIYPSLILVVSVIFLREKIGWRRWFGVVVGFIGVLFVVQPRLHHISTGVLFALGSGCAYAATLMLTRRLSMTDVALTTATTSALIGTMLYTGLAPFVWRPPAPTEWLWMVAMGIIAAIGHLLIINAHRLAKASFLAPCGYTEIVAAIFFGVVVFGDMPQWPVLVGMLLIVGSGIGVLLRRAPSD
jgi:drug/metabolite transporter (DMT)-like permease